MSQLRFGYNTNGFSYHDLPDVLSILSEFGYRGIALTLDTHHLNPFTSRREDINGVKRLLKRHRFGVAIETGARYLLNLREKHEPTLVSERGRDRRIYFLKRAIDIAVILEAEAVSFWAGGRQGGVSRKKAYARLLEGCREIARYAAGRKVTLAFEPEPGMLVDVLAGYDRLAEQVDRENFRLALDVGHIPVTERLSVPQAIRRYGKCIAAVHLDDVRGRRHEHLIPGEGEIPWRETLAAFREIGYRGLLNVELNRHSHAAPETARRAIEFLKVKS